MDDHYYTSEYSVENDDFVYPNGVLINNLNIQTTADLNVAEIEFTKRRLLQLQENPIPGNFDLAHLQAIHRHIFQDIYPWAGVIRTVDICKNDTIFLPCNKIEKVFSELADNIKKEGNLVGLPQTEFSARLGDYLGKINIAHPFREGNGRTQRTFTKELARQAGYDLQWQGIGNDAMKNACISAEKGNSSELARLIKLNITPNEHNKAQGIKNPAPDLKPRDIER